jgi:ubiquinone/menaquinone biosynthesis C-methylase UbiE
MNKAGDPVRQHFDSIAENYNEEIPEHIREHLNAKWWGLVSSYFTPDARVLDIGCGDGTNAAFLTRKGISVVGVDFSSDLIRRGKQRHLELENLLFEGNALSLDFADRAFDVAIMTGVLHHIYSREDQEKAVREALRIVRNDGVLIIRESNLINPLFRLFWNYIFPLTSKIDRFGGENWIPARHIKRLFGKRVDRTCFFTFIPNFTPRFLLPLAARIERALELSSFRKLSAHYIVVLKNKGEVSLSRSP